MKILIVEDDQSLAQSLRKNLKNIYVVDLAYSGHQALLEAYSNPYDLIILDLQLPDMEGCHICQELRAAKLTMPILIISGRKRSETLAPLIEAGADDYITKPFTINELRAKLKALLRRADNGFTPEIIELGPLKLNPGAQITQYNNRLINLSRKEYLLLQLLMRHKNIALSRTQLFEHVWESGREFKSNTVDVHICTLRDKLGSSGKELIKTVHGTGYMFKIEDES